MSDNDTKMTEPMSKEEMIYILKGLVFGTFDRTTAKEREALNMAIELLEKEPCEDTISRQAGIEGLTELINNLKGVQGDMGSAVNAARELITSLSPVKPQEPKWIPVSERLPKEEGSYMTTLDYGEYGLSVGQRFYYGKDYGWTDGHVIAWMPLSLPKPYKPQESEG